MKRILALLLMLALLLGSMPAGAEELLPIAAEEIIMEETVAEEPAAEEPAIEEPAEIPAETTPEPAAEPSAEPTIEVSAGPAAEPSAEPAVEASAEPTVEVPAGPSAEPDTEPAAEAEIEPSADASAQPAPETVLEAAPEAASEEPALLAAAPALMPPMVVFGENWFHDPDGAAVIPCEAGDSSFTIEWTFGSEAASYRIQSAEIPEKGEEEVRLNVAVVTEKKVELPTAAYSEGPYMLYINASMEDGSVVSNQLRFRLEMPKQIVLNAQEVSLGVGESFILESVNTAGCSFTSSKPKYASVDASGKISAKRAGSAVITVEYGGLSAECKVTILRAPSSVTISEKKKTVSVGQSVQLMATVNKNSAGAIGWSSNSGIAAVDANGVVTAHQTGTAKITATSYNGKKASCTLTIVPAPSFIRLDVESLSLPMGMSAQLNPSSDKGSNPGFTYESSDENIAVVDANGKITAVNTGAAIITASTYNGYTAACAVTVTPAPTAVTLNSYAIELGVGEKFQLIPAVDQGDDAGYTYASKAARTAAVDKNGLITAKKAGTTVVRVTTFNGVYADCEVTVKRAPSSIKFSTGKIQLGVGQSAMLEVALSKNSTGAYTLTSDSDIIAINADNSVTALAAGAAKITAKTYNGKKGSCTVTVVPAPGSVAIETAEYSIPMGMTAQLKPVINDGSMTSFAYASSDQNIAVVDESGAITAVNTGTAIITVTTHNGLAASCTVNVTPAPSVITLNADALELGVGEKYQISASADHGEDAGFTYQSKTTRVATVDKNGLITAKKAGTTVIRVTAFNGVYA
ncbi:MAG: Ig-like domain-containing protein, partial [Clostridia bacterium]|nr:Ig-like domain-containing protein [Clostridia bacterium]